MSEGTAIEINCRITADDFKRVLVWRSRFNRWLLIVIFCTYFLFFMLSLISMLGPNGTPINLKLIGILSLPLIIFGVLLFSSHFQTNKQAKIAADASEETEIRFDEDGMTAIAASSSASSSWEKYFKAVELKDDFIFFPTKQLMFPIPKRFYQDDVQVSEMRELVKRKLGSKAKLL